MEVIPHRDEVTADVLLELVGRNSKVDFRDPFPNRNIDAIQHQRKVQAVVQGPAVVHADVLADHLIRRAQHLMETDQGLPLKIEDVSTEGRGLPEIGRWQLNEFEVGVTLGLPIQPIHRFLQLHRLDEARR